MKKIGLVIPLWLAGCFSVNIPLGGVPKEYDEKVVSEEPRAEGKIALVDLEGILTSDHHESIFGTRESAVVSFVEKLKKAEADEEVRAVVVRIDSPGGPRRPRRRNAHRSGPPGPGGACDPPPSGPGRGIPRPCWARS